MEVMCFMHLNRQLYIVSKIDEYEDLFPELLELKFEYSLGSSFLFNIVLIFQHPNISFLHKLKLLLYVWLTNYDSYEEELKIFIL
jgi:hypothetical protein